MAEEPLRKTTISRSSLEAAEEVLRRWMIERRDSVEVIKTEMGVTQAVRFDGVFRDLFTFTITFKLKERSVA